MTAPAIIHYELEVFADCYSTPLCENHRELDCFTEGDPDAEMTDDEALVSCPDCLRALGFDVAPDTQRVRIAA